MDDTRLINFVKHSFGRAGSLLLHGLVSSCGECGECGKCGNCSLVAVHRLLLAVASLAAERGL